MKPLQRMQRELERLSEEAVEAQRLLRAPPFDPEAVPLVAVWWDDVSDHADKIARLAEEAKQAALACPRCGGGDECECR